MLGLVFGLFIVLLFLGLPMAIAMIIPCILPSMVTVGFPGTINYVLRAVVSGLDQTTILAIPLFMLSGAIMAKGGISKKLFDVFALLIGKVPAGMPCAVVATCLFYGAISGSGPATVAAVGAMCIPVLTNLGYDKKFACAIVCTAGGLGVIIPPSIPFIMYGVVTGESVGAMFTAGIVPGCLIAACLMIYCLLYCFKHCEDKERTARNVQELRDRGVLRVLIDAVPAILTPVIILGGIYSGIVTPTEAACVSVFYAIIVSLFIYRTIEAKEIVGFLAAAVRSYAPICLMIAFAVAFGRILTLVNGPAVIAGLLTTTFNSRFTFLLALNIAMLIMGMFMDTASAIAILGPVLLATATSFGISGIQFGVILVTNLAVGLVSPPVGINLFVGAPLVNETPGTIGKAALPAIGFFLVALALITYIPAVSLCLL